MFDMKMLMGTAGFAAVASMWGQIKGFFIRFRSLFIVTVNLKYGLSEPVTLYLWKNFRRGMLGNKGYVAKNMFVRPKKVYEKVVFEKLDGASTFYQGWRPIYVSVGGKENNDDGVTITFIRGMFNIEEFLLGSVKEYNDIEHDKKKEEGNQRYAVRNFYGKYDSSNNTTSDDIAESSGNGASSGENPIGWKWGDLGASYEKKPFSSLFYPKEVRDFISLLEKWKDSKDWYKDRMLPWRMGAGLEGLAGSGKSSLVRAIAQHFDFPVDKYDLTSMSNEEFGEYWRRSLNRAPCIVLIEDIDRVFHGDQMVANNDFSQKGKLTMDGILNCISGVESSDGILLFITCNDITKLDTALGVSKDGMKSTRPGRLDHILHFGAMDLGCRKQLAEVILADTPDLIMETVSDGDGETGAQFAKRCSDIALNEYWKPKGGV